MERMRSDAPSARRYLEGRRRAGADDLAYLAADISKTVRELPGEVIGLSRTEDASRPAHRDLDAAANDDTALLAARRALIVCSGSHSEPGVQHR